MPCGWVHQRNDGLSTLLGVACPLALCGLCLTDARRNTPPDPAVCADLAFAALVINSDIIPLLFLSASPGLDIKSWTHYVSESCVCASFSCKSQARTEDA